MDKAQKWRWTAITVAMGLTIAAIVYPLEQDVGVAFVSNENQNVNGNLTKEELISPKVNGFLTPALAVYADLFAPQGWRAQPKVIAPEPIKKAVVVPELIGPPAPPALIPAPPLPFRFTGRLNDGGEQVIYLGKGEMVFLARAGDTLDHAYKIITIGPRHIEFEHLPTGEKQTLNLPASEN